ncbi:MAG: PHB depolymerase family esterase [Dehalococcoidia bacterium]
MRPRFLLLLGLGVALALAWSLLPARHAVIAQDGCSPARAHQAGSFDETIESGGETRDYILHIPPSYSGGDATPLVLNFHGLGSNSQDQADYTGLPDKADEEGFIVVMPQGLVTDLIPIPHWNNTLLEPSPNDVAFVRDLIDQLEAELCIDPARVFSTGMSMGAMISTRLACDLSDRIAAIAPVAGLYFPPLADELPEVAECNSSRPVPIIAFHGTDDPIVPFNGGLPSDEDFDFRLHFHDIDGVVIETWAAHNGCNAEPSREPVTAGVYRLRYTGCNDGADIELYVIDGGGHTWPDATSDEEGLGFTTHEISANDLLWDFFEQHPLVAAAEADATAPAAQLPDTGGADESGGLDTMWSVAIGAGVAAIVVAGSAAALFARRRGG